MTIRFGEQIEYVVCPCGELVYGELPSGISAKPAPPPRIAAKPDDWWVRILTRLQTSEDRGIGDTVQRIAAKFGGERFKRFAKRIGLPCGCTGRQARWNADHPNPNYRG